MNRFTHNDFSNIRLNNIRLNNISLSNIRPSNKFLLFLFLISNLVCPTGQAHPATTEVIPISEIQEFNSYPASLKKLIYSAHILSKQHLTYTYGSSDPKNGGMDCSGTIYYLLKTNGVEDVPRSSDDIYHWLEKKGKLNHTISAHFNSAEFSKLKPGDLLFWSGTYRTNRPNSISHVMLYLGKSKKNEPLMFGSSDGRTYQGNKMWGVSVFDFKLPKQGEAAKFAGYGCIPSLTCK